ncbi:S8 family serine peptidase [Micromonospora coerulea]|uniref:S8 family serine peptidase n=1 Tax=Micromonospora coerulea TaxID=47856 RepID=A0ABP8SC95_9ACTN
MRMSPRTLGAAFAAAAVTAALVGAPPAGAAPATADGPARTYLVLYKQTAVPSDAADTVRDAGGEIVAAYDAIGALVARSGYSGFADAMQKDVKVEGASATDRFGVQVGDVQADGHDEQAPELPNSPATDGDNLSPLQWDMRQISTPQAHAVTGGSRTVVVGDIDTGLDFTHPDIAPNYSAADSADCSSGAPAPLRPGNDVNGHGTHTAGTIAAASNGIGIVGVAPNVRIAGIKSSTDAGFFFPEMVVCSFMWAAERHLDVTNNSYFADPFLFNCRNDKAQHAIWKAEQRAIRHAMNQGVTVVAAAGNESEDLSHPGIDTTSPDFPPGTEQTRDVTNACVVVPVEIPGVIGVSANGHNEQADSDEGPDYLKSFYSSYGVSAVDVVAPGGDSVYGRNAEAPNGRVLSTYPATTPCLRREVDPNEPSAVYCYLQGTSMASPHVAGVAALVVSRYGDLQNPQNGKMRPGQVEQYVTQTADPQPCPASVPAGYETVTTSLGEPQACQGGPGFNSWYGKGQVNALRAVTHDTGGNG